LRSRRNTIGDSSSGSKPDEQHGLGRLDVGVGHARPPPRTVATTWLARKLGLLDRVRPRPEVDVVGLQDDPANLL
jgi:hypothetical protein